MWSFTPISGEGAAKTGGRFNRKGQRALYLALDLNTMLNECMAGLTQRLQPLTICEYDIDCDPVADLRNAAARAEHSVAIGDLACAWLRHLRGGEQAPSWQVADRLAEEGFAGILVPSFAPGAGADNHNLVLWRWGPDVPTKVAVFDPAGRLPKDQLSWA